MSDVENARHRTDSKLRFAKVHLTELEECPTKGHGHDFERAHQESFLFHLLGVRDAFLQELNIYYECGLSLNQENKSRLQDKLDRKGVHCWLFCIFYPLSMVIAYMHHQ